MLWKFADVEYRFPRPVLVMGILNVTPDSFSDGGRFAEAEAAVEQGMRMIDGGAELLDVGGESTRPYADPVTEEEELRRVIPVIRKLRAQTAVPISIDTVKPAVAEAALDHGASIINDVAANRSDPEMWRLAARTGAGYVAMHMKGDPRTMQESPVYENVVEEVFGFLALRLRSMQAEGVRLEQVALDPGIGFGKTLEHNLQLLASLERFRLITRPLLLGVSRKSFIGKVCGAKVDERLPGSLACAALAVRSGVHIIRAHDAAETVQAVRVAEAILNAKE